MFKIENYIAPLILSKIEKFVKNINQHEFQVSLWQGDVMFQNLELKLDVLEEELQLPVNFLSGHINDLKIQIPWTKIASEPIIITINTIELVVKLKDFSSAPPAPKPKLKKKISFDEDANAGYMASLISKIVNNISVICNNIVLKFLEEDIVVSMNIQHLSVHSADHRWKRAFIDVSPTNVLFRKLINIIDFTICLDKRNSSGKIEFVQEPILYKCSMELRLFRKHNAMHPTKLSTTRIDVQTNSLNLSISSQQFPMLMRLYDLFMALKSGRLQAKYAENQQTQPSNEHVEPGDDESWLLWAWNMIPAILPDEESLEEFDTENKKIFEFGLYVDDINLVLKAQEFLSDPIIPSTKKAIFKPLLAIHLQEFYNTAILSGVRKFNVKCGIGFAEVLALEECTCGAYVTDPQLVTAGIREKTGSYLKDSFMDKTAAAMQTKYEGMWTNYYEKNSEEVLLEKTPALAVDIFHSIELPDDTRSSVVGSDLEFSNFSEVYVIRVFGSGFVVSAGAELFHRVEKIVQYYKDCDFLPYVENEKPLMKNQLSPATADDYDALTTEVPMRIVQMKLRNVLVQLKEWEHERPPKALRKLAKQTSFVGQFQKKSVLLELKIDDFLMEVRQPLYRNRLIYTACQLPDNIENELFDKCFFILTMTLKNVRVDMKFETEKRICEVVSVGGSMRRIIYPHLWTGMDIKENLFELESEGLSIMLNPAQLMALSSLVKSIVTKCNENEIEKDVTRNLENAELVVVQLMAHKVKLNVDETVTGFFSKLTVSDLLGLAWKSGVKSIIVNWPDGATPPESKPFAKKLRRVEDLLTIHAQTPKETSDQTLLPVVTMKLNEGSVSLDPMLSEFLSFKVTPDEVKPERLVRTISTSTKPAVNPSSNNQPPSVHSSSDCDVTICPQGSERDAEKENKDFADWIEKYKVYIVNVELKPVTFYYSTKLMEPSKASDSLKALMSRSDGQTFVLKLPNIIFHSVKNKGLAEMVAPHFTAELPFNLWGNERVFTWNFVLGSLTAYTMNQKRMFNLIHDFSMNVSIADESATNQSTEKLSTESLKIFTANLLIETSPLSTSVHTSQVSFMKAFSDEITSFPVINHFMKSQSTKVRAEKALSVIQESPQNTSEIKEFLGLATGSTTTKASHADDKSKRHNAKCSFYVQWVCSKISLTLLADELEIEKKFLIEVDEILISLHQQDFYQLKSKIASISGVLYEREKNEEKWTKNITLGVNVQSDENISDNANRFLDLTITKAETANVHTRWNIGHKRNRLYNDDITEINVVIQPLDIIANLDELIHFMPIMSAFRATKAVDRVEAVPRLPLAGSELPLIHVMCSGFRVFLPCSSENLQTTDVLIVKINNLHVTPTAVNNLIRNQILRPDIHSKACALGILDLAGSKIEDRQYQLTVKGVSLSTSNWDGIAALINEKTTIESYDNPAFEWNNLENGPKSPNFKLNTVFKDSTFSFIFAPCIRFKETLVAGTAMEFNCVNDMAIEMTMKELALFITVSERISSILRVLQPVTVEPKVACDKKEAKQDDLAEIPMHFEKRRMFEKKSDKKSVDDSGVESISYSNRAHERKTWRKKASVAATAGDDATNVPFEFTFTSSKFKLRCSLDDGNDIVVVLDTPNVFVTQDKYEKSVNVSLYDLFVMYGMEKLFSTRDGIADASGIKPSLIRMKISEKMVKSTECEIQVKRPMAVEFSHENLVQILQLMDLLQKHSILKKSSKNRDIPIAKKVRKFDVVKSFLNNTRTFSFSTNQIMLNAKSHEYDFKFAVSELKGKVKAFDRPEKIEASCEVVQLLLLNRSKMIFHPMSAQAKVKIAQEYWKVDPLVHVNLNCNFIRFDVGWDFLREIQVCRKMFEDVLVHRKHDENVIGDSGPKVPLYALPSRNFTNKVEATIEHFQDDLRSGAFQFIETASTRDLPLPYQIQIIDNEVGVICWRYPLPRALQKIKIFPVPFQTANQVTIICKIEFYSQLKSKFEEFCDFTLTENETKLLDLKQNRPSAEVWRIKIPRVFLKRDSDDEDEGGDYEFQMHPKVLVACLRIDSYYVSSAIPNLDVFLNISHVEVNVMNKMVSAEKVPEIVENFQLMDDRGKEHEAGKLVVKDVKVFGQFFDENYENFEVDATVGAEVIDYGCGNLVPVLDDFRFKALVDLHQGDFNLNFMAEKIQLKYSPAMGHSLLMTKKLWEQSIDERNAENEMVLHTKYIICNNTASPVGLNQFATNEMIYVMPKTFVLYSFRTDKMEQSIQFCVCLRGAWSLKTAPVKMQSDGIEYVRLDDHQFFVVSVKSVTNFQKRVTIDGTVVIFNMTKEIFRLQYKRYDKEIDAPDKSEAIEFDVGAHQSNSVFGVCMADSQQSIRLRLAKSDKKVLSGEIPLREIVVNNKPWLVKVPSLSKCGFTSFWVRIIRETKDEISRVLVMIWPMFVAKSLLPVNTIVYEALHDENYLILGRGQKQELDMSGTHEDEHELLLKGNYAMLDDEEAKVKLSYKLINRASFFKIPDEFGNIDRAIELLETQTEAKWPCARDEEFRSHRELSVNGPTLPVYHLASQNPEELSCSLMLTLSPWCSVINSTGHLVKLTNSVSTESCSVEANNIVMPFYINNTFTISVLLNEIWAQSEPICINTDIKQKVAHSYALPVEGSLALNIHTDTEIVQLVVKSTIENKMRLIVISSLVVVVNLSKHELKLFAFTADVGDKLEGIKRNEVPTKQFVSVDSDCNKQGRPLVAFTDLCCAKGKRKNNATFSSLLAISCGTDEASFPMKIQPITRKCLNVPSKTENLPMSVSVIKHNEQCFVVINDDPSPFMGFKNDTDFNIFVAQTDLSNPTTKYILPHKEVSDERFSAFQTVPSKQQVFYTPPIFNEHFPEISNPDFGLIFACVTGDDFIRWSQPVKVDGTKKIIIQLPMFGDVKLDINTQHKTTHVTIGYIQNEKDDTIVKHEPSRDFYRAISQQSFLEVNSNYQKTFSVARKTSVKAFNVNFYSKGVCVTLYKDGERKRVEQISLNIDEVGAKYSKLACKLKINFAKIQVDNELYETGEYDFPVVLCNKDMPNMLNHQVAGTSIWDLSEILDQQQSLELFSFDVDLYNAGGIENLQVRLQPIRLYIEDTFITVLLEMVEDCLPSNLIVRSGKGDDRVRLEDGKVLVPIAVMEQAIQFADPLRIKLVRLEPLHVLLSVHTCMRMYIALDHSPLDFSAYEKVNVNTLPMKLGNSMGLHYLSSALFGAGWVVGSLEILGSPSGLARSVTSGVKDFVYMPVQGLFQGPWEFLVGLTHGSVSLVRNVTTGTVNSVTKLATSVARNLDRLTLDNDHIHLKTDASRRHRPHGLTEGFQQGLTGFGISILGAIGGLARHPLQAKSTVEVFTGVGKGIVGVFAKPISGAAEFVALTGTGMLQSVGYNLLPSPISHSIENHLMQPTADKIISKQLPQYATTNATLFTCRGTFSRKNDIKNSFVILMSHVLVIADLDRDMVIDVIPLERIQPITKSGCADNLFVFKIKDDEDSPTSHEKYPVSKRTVQYIQQLSGHKISVGERSSEENSEEENGFLKLDAEDVESFSAIGSDKKISFYIDEVTGKYLVAYITLVKSQLQSKNSLFPLFDT